MTTHSPHDDVLAKMDALLKRHHDRLESPSRPEPDFPVLTEVILTEEPIPTLIEVVEEEASALDDFPFLVLEETDLEPVPEIKPEQPSFVLSRHSLENLEMQIHDFQDQRLSAHIAHAVDQALATMLDQFSLRLDAVVCEAIDLELQRQMAEVSHLSE